tara:strand:- start:2791 stop:3063 length:273 start_codon:yes stop_codon:yes gene_type:complete
MKITDRELIELIAKNILGIIRRLEELEDISLHSEEILQQLEDIFKPDIPDMDRDRDLITGEDEIVAFSKELYKQICDYCGKEGIQFMGIA